METLIILIVRIILYQRIQTVNIYKKSWSIKHNSKLTSILWIRKSVMQTRVIIEIATNKVYGEDFPTLSIAMGRQI